MQNPISKRGIIFSNFKDLVFFHTKLFKSESDFLLQVSKMKRPDLNFGSDDQFFRKLRKGDLNDTELMDHFNKITPELEMDQSLLLPEGWKTENHGAWVDLSSMIKGLKQHSLLKTPELSTDYFDFLIALCHIDRDLIELFKMNTLECDYSKVDAVINDWLLIKNFDSQNCQSDKGAGARLTISTILHWSALLEVFLEMEFDTPGYEYTSILSKCLPELSNGELVRTNEVLLNKIRIKWQEVSNSGKNIKWSELYRDIVRKQNPDSEQDQDHPLIDNIKKKFNRWINGETRTRKNAKKVFHSFISIESFQKDLAILFTSREEQGIDFSMFTIVFIQLFEMIQIELQNMNIENKFIYEQFRTYPTYLDKVRSRYKHYQLTSELIP